MPSEHRKAYMKEYLKSYGPKWANDNPDKKIKHFEKYYCTLKGRATHMLNNAKQRANRYGMECDLDQAFILEKLEIGLCEVTKIPFVFVVNGGKGHKLNSFSPSLDRIDNTKGYTKDNVQVVCWIYNRAKGAFPLADLTTMVLALSKEDSPQIH